MLPRLVENCRLSSRGGSGGSRILALWTDAWKSWCGGRSPTPCYTRYSDWCSNLIETTRWAVCLKIRGFAKIATLTQPHDFTRKPTMQFRAPQFIQFETHLCWQAIESSDLGGFWTLLGGAKGEGAYKVLDLYKHICRDSDKGTVHK